jgi:hypothetical protein
MTEATNDCDKLLLVGVDDASDSDNEAELSDCDSTSDEERETETRSSQETTSFARGRFAPDSMMDFMASHIDDAQTRSVAYDRTVSVKLKEPGVDAICPISMDQISSSTVCGFEGFLLDESRPKFTEALLACGHSFSACYLIVSWLTSPMRCPLCRAGIDSVLEIDSIPCKWKDVSDAHVKRLRQQDTEQQMIDLRALQAEEVLQAIFAIHIHMCVYITLPDTTIQASVVNFVNAHALPLDDPEQILHLRVSRAQIRSLSRSIVRQNAVTMNLVVFARRVGSTSSIQLGEITRSGPLHVPVQPSVRSSIVNPIGVPVREVVIVQRADIQVVDEDGESTHAVSALHRATFSMNWEVYASRSMNTLMDISFSVKLADLALFVGGMIVND